MILPVAGLLTPKVAPLLALRHSPLMKASSLNREGSFNCVRISKLFTADKGLLFMLMSLVVVMNGRQNDFNGRREGTENCGFSFKS